jgi:hypothetical protein
MCQWDRASCRRCPLAFSFCSSCVPSVVRCQSLVVALVFSRLDYGNATLVGITKHLLLRLQSVMNSAARLIYSSLRSSHITLLLRQLHWLKAKERIDFKVAVLVYKCQHCQHHRISLTSSVVRQTCKAEVVSVPHRLLGWSSDRLPTLLLAIDLSW